MARIGQHIPEPERYETWREWARAFGEAFRHSEAESVVNQLPPIPVSRLPSAKQDGLMAFIPDETGGATLAFTDGTNWRRVQDRVIVS